MWLPSSGKLGKHLAGIICWTRSGQVCARNTDVFTRSPVGDGGCAVMSGTWTAQAHPAAGRQPVSSRAGTYQGRGHEELKTVHRFPSSRQKARPRPGVRPDLTAHQGEYRAEREHCPEVCLMSREATSHLKSRCSSGT